MATITGGDKLKTYLKGSNKLAQPGTLRVGFLEGATYPNGTPVAMIAAIQEFGAPRARIPPRPFFRNMIAAKKGEWGPAVAGLLKDHSPKEALAIAGESIGGQLRQSIIDTNTPPLSPITLMLRKMRGEGVVITGKQVGIAAARVAAGESTAGVSTKPLIFTSHLINSVDYEIS